MNFNSIQSIVTLISMVVGGGFAVLYFIGGNARGRREENDRITTELINNLTKTVEQQKVEIDLLRAQMKDYTAVRDAEVKDLAEKLNHLQGRNGLLEEILKGRDPIQEKVFSQALGIFDIARENNKLSKQNVQAIEKLTLTLETFIRKITPALPMTVK